MAGRTLLLLGECAVRSFTATSAILAICPLGGMHRMHPRQVGVEKQILAELVASIQAEAG